MDTPQNKTIDVQTQETDGGNNGNGSKNKILAIIAVIVLIVVAFVAYRSCGTNESKVDELTNTIVSDSTEKEKADTTSHEEKSASSITAGVSRSSLAVMPKGLEKLLPSAPVYIFSVRRVRAPSRFCLTSAP